MHTWPVQDAKARFSEILETSLTEGPQVVTKHGKATAAQSRCRGRHSSAGAWQIEVAARLMFLLDTNVVSESHKPKPHGGAMAWSAAREATTIYISAMTIGELQRGVELTRTQDATRH